MYTCVCAHTHVFMYMYTCMCIHTCMYIHTRACTCTRTHTRGCVSHAHTRARVSLHVHVCVRTHVSHVQVCACTCTRACMHVCTCISIPQNPNWNPPFHKTQVCVFFPIFLCLPPRLHGFVLGQHHRQKISCSIHVNSSRAHVYASMYVISARALKSLRPPLHLPPLRAQCLHRAICVQ
jgi:hypothetical protein